MKYLTLPVLALMQLQAMQYDLQFENDRVRVIRVVLDPHEKVGLHRDALQQIVVGLKGGTVTRLEADGREVDVVFPTGQAVYRPIDPEGEYHEGVNASDEELELIIVQLKD